MHKIIADAIETEGQNLNDVSLSHIKGKILLSLEKFKIDGVERTLTVSSALGLIKKGKKVSLISKRIQQELSDTVDVEDEIIMDKDSTSDDNEEQEIVAGDDVEDVKTDEETTESVDADKEVEEITESVDAEVANDEVDSDKEVEEITESEEVEVKPVNVGKININNKKIGKK